MMIADFDIHAWSPVVLALHYPRTFYIALLLFFLIAAFAWWFLPHYVITRLIPEDLTHRQATESSVRKDLSLFYAGSVVVFGVIGAIIQFQANVERDYQQRDASLSVQNGELFEKAVTRLDSASALSTLSAISSLTELMRQKGYYWASVSEISEFLRKSISQHADLNALDKLNAIRALSTRDAGAWSNRFTEPFPLDFSGLDLTDFRFSQLWLWGSTFRSTNLTGSQLPGAKMESTDFECANFERAQLQMSSLFETTDPTEIGPKLNRVNFRHANLSKVIFKTDSNNRVHVEDACFEGATLDGADLSGFDLSEPSGLTRSQIEKTSAHPPIPADFDSKVKKCKEFKEICLTTPASK
jgi:uncharacterized protein YjbI with pentapeptide repeats